MRLTMKMPCLFAAGAVLLTAGACDSRAPSPASPTRAEPADLSHCRRIVSMAPSITETLFALGLGDRVVGVTQFCQYPPEAAELPKVGGHLNPNLEAIFALRPDVVVTLTEAEGAQRAMEEWHIRTLVVCHQNVDGILDSITTLGRRFGVEPKADRMAADIRRRLARIDRKTAGLPRPRVMFVVDRTMEREQLKDVYIAGRDGVFDRLAALAGGESVGRSSPARFPIVSAEGIVWMNPQVIIDMSAGVAERNVDDRDVVRSWQAVAVVDAVRDGRVYAVRDDYAFIPGPRFILLVEKLARLIHPEVDWRQ